MAQAWLRRTTGIQSKFLFGLHSRNAWRQFGLHRAFPGLEGFINDGLAPP
jgi:hypothetical protein